MSSKTIDFLHSFSRFSDRGFRPGQENAILKVVEGGEKKVSVVEAPTGSGKTIIGMTAGSMIGPFSYMTHSKILQNQITEEFPEARSLFGRGNYPCLVGGGNMCDTCFHDGKDIICEKKGACLYEVAKLATLRHDKRILNYDYFMYEANYVGRFSDQEFVVVDEADNLENALVNFVSLKFSDFAFKRLGLEGPARKTATSRRGIEPWVDFVSLAKRKAGYELERLQGATRGLGVESMNTPSAVTLLKGINRLQSLIGQMDIFLKNVDDTWMYDDQQEGWHIFRPLWITKELADKFFWKHSDRFLLMSASFLPIHLVARTLGLSLDSIGYTNMPSNFPRERRPIYINPACNLTAATMEQELPKLCKEIRRIINEHPNDKGIIHGVSYKLSRAIVEGVGDSRLFVHGSSDRQDALDRFIDSDDPLVLVSPSMERGVSLDGDKARFVIVAKAPYLSLGDKVVKTRIYSSKWGNLWYIATMLLTVLQMAGRGMRSADDYCETYILDKQFDKALSEHPTMLPLWWREAIV